MRAWNPAFLDYFRITADRLRGADRCGLLAALAQQSQRFGGEGWELALLPTPGCVGPGREDVQLPSGEVLERWMNVTPRGDCVIALFDVTARRLAEAGPRGGGVGTWDRDLEHDTVTWSDRYWSMLGYDPRAVPEPVRQRHESDWPYVLHPADRPAVVRNVREAYAGHLPLLQDTRVLRADGKWLWVTWRGQLIRDLSGRVVRVVGTQTDIQATVEAEQALRHSRDEAAAEAQRKSGFVASLGHELRTPLAGIIGNLTLLERELRGRSAQKRVQGTLRAASELTQVLDAVLESARAEVGQLPTSAAVFSPRRLLGGIAELMDPLARQQGLHLGVEVDPAVPEWVAGPELTLRQILLNLTSNAVKYTDTGSVLLRLVPRKAVADEWCFQVADTGRGIPAGMQGRLFERFYRHDGEGKAGSGLGLYIVEQLAAAIRAAVTVESAPGEGTTFSVCLSLAPAAAPAATPATPGHRLRLLLVEDVAANREMLCDLLASEGHDVTAVASGEAAVRAMTAEAVDAVLMDVRLEGMSGREAARRIRRIGGEAATVPVIALSAEDLPAGPEADPDFDGILRKPLCLDSLYRILDDIPARAAAASQGTDERLNELAAALGSERLCSLLRALRETFRGQRAALAASAVAADDAMLAVNAHRLAGAAANYGYYAVEARAQALRSAGASAEARAALDAALVDALEHLERRLTLREGHDPGSKETG